MMSHLELMTDDIYSPSPLISFLEVASPVSSCCCCSGTTQSCPALCDPMDCSTPAFPVLQYLLEFAQTHVHQVRDAIQPSHPLLLLFFLPYSFPALVSSNLSALGIRWPKYWSFSFSISPSNEYSQLIFFRIEWLDLLAVQGTLKNLLQHHISKASVLWCSVFFMVQLSYLFMATEKTIALIIWTLVGIVMSLLFNMLSSFWIKISLVDL